MAFKTSKYNKILIIGNCGSGKSTLSRQISSILELPVIHLDKYYWSHDWKTTPPEEWEKIVRNLVIKEKWIIDGNYYNTLKIRMAQAELILFLNVNPIICLFRVLKRIFMEKNRPDMPKGYADRFDLKFYKYILSYNRKMKPKIMQLLKQTPSKVKIVTINNPIDANDILIKIN